MYPNDYYDHVYLQLSLTSFKTYSIKSDMNKNIIFILK